LQRHLGLHGWAGGIEKIVKVQEKAVKVNTGLQSLEYKERCSELGLETMEERRLKQDMTLFHKLIQEGPRKSILHRATITKKVSTWRAFLSFGLSGSRLMLTGSEGKASGFKLNKNCIRHHNHDLGLVSNLLEWKKKTKKIIKSIVVDPRSLVSWIRIRKSFISDPDPVPDPAPGPYYFSKDLKNIFHY
jgi:hypothetical protein